MKTQYQIKIFWKWLDISEDKAVRLLIKCYPKENVNKILEDLQGYRREIICGTVKLRVV